MYTSKLALLAVISAAAILFINDSEGVPRPTISQGCYRCLCHVSTYCRIINQCEDTYCGPFNISKVYWEDAGKITLKDDDPERNGAWKDCAKDYFCAQKIIEGYVNKFSKVIKDCNKDGVVNCLDYMMINSNGGSDCTLPLNETATGRVWIERYEECRIVGLLP